MKLQRYGLSLTKDGPMDVTPITIPSPAGELVFRTEALDWFESLLEDMRVPVSTIPEELHAIATNKERARLRALIAAERGKV